MSLEQKLKAFAARVATEFNNVGRSNFTPLPYRPPANSGNLLQSYNNLLNQMQVLGLMENQIGFNINNLPAIENMFAYWKLDETTGVRTNALNSGTRDLQVNGTIASIDGVFEKGIEFTGDVNYLSVNHHSSISVAENFTVSLWFKIDDFSGFKKNYLLVKSDGVYDVNNSNTDLSIAFYSNQYIKLSLNEAFQNNYFFVGNLQPNEWYHLVLVHADVEDVDEYDNPVMIKALKVFLNGNSLISPSFYIDYRPNIAVDTGKPLRFGGYKNESNVALDEIGYWTIALSNEEVEELYNLYQ